MNKVVAQVSTVVAFNTRGHRFKSALKMKQKEREREQRKGYTKDNRT